MSRQVFSKQLLLFICTISLLLLSGCGLLPGSGGDDVVDIPQTGGEQVAEEAGEVVEEGGETAEQGGEETAVAEGEATTEEGTAEEATESTEGEAATEETVAEESGETAVEETSPRTDEEEGTAEEAATEEATSEESIAEEASTEETAEATDGEAASEETTAEETTTEESSEETVALTESSEERTHIVADGENLYRIGLQYGVSWVVLQQYNNMANVNSLTIGQEIKIPAAAEPDTAEPAPTPTPTPTDEQTYTVKEGDNLYRIGLQYGLDWTQIAEANGIVNAQQLAVGQLLKIPASQPGDSPEFTHVVKDGETLFLIAIQYGTTWSSIAEANELSSPYVIYPDQTLIIPSN